ncbi:MAG: hypothetical protein QG578_636 [Thermodesulfobacteriota bacterium]|nr:hypothetical protein [Thermodesulfobacteriota bacterium]
MKDIVASSNAFRASARKAGFGPWLNLLIGIVLILTFIFGIGSLAQFLPGARHMAEVIDERNLRATAIFYTDFDEPAEGSARIGDSIDYMPGLKE